MEKLKIDGVVVAEGKYDKIKLSSVIDAPIVTTDGFSIFNNAEKRAMLKALAERSRIIILTDSDGAGFVIRNKLKSIIGNSGSIINIYIPRVKGKEQRKNKPSK